MTKPYSLIRRCTEHKGLVVVSGKSCSFLQFVVGFFPRGKNLEKNKNRHEACQKLSKNLRMEAKSFHLVLEVSGKVREGLRKCSRARKAPGGPLGTPSQSASPKILPWVLSSGCLLRECPCSLPCLPTPISSWCFPNKCRCPRFPVCLPAVITAC